MQPRAVSVVMALRDVIVKQLGPHHKLISSAGFVVALIIFLMFDCFDRRTEIEEHALIAGYNNPGLTGNHWQQVLDRATRTLASAPSVMDGLNATLTEAQLISHKMDFSMYDDTVRGEVAFTVVSSHRGDSREAVVFAFEADWSKNAQGGFKEAAYSLGVGITAASYLSTVNWLSKDIIFVFVDSSLPYGAGMRAWLRAYFGGKSAFRRGVLRQAVILDSLNDPEVIFADIEGINGALPNQDLVNSWMIEAKSIEPPPLHRPVWESVLYHFSNGGVHSSHAAFLELQVPSFTVRGQKRSVASKHPRYVKALDIARSFEGIARCTSNNLQQLHHSFNFYFFTGPRAHISSGLYLYPVFAMLFPILSYLMTTSAYRDVRAFLVGLTVVACTIIVTGSPMFVLLTEKSVANQMPGEFKLPECAHPASYKPEAARRTVFAGLSSAAGAVAMLTVLLRRWAFVVFREESAGDGKAVSSLKLPVPLWEAVRASAGLAWMLVLAPITIYSWSVAAPLTITMVPVTILTLPASLRHRPLRTTGITIFLVANIFFLVVSAPTRKQLLRGPFDHAVTCMGTWYQKTLLKSIPREMQSYMPTAFVRFIQKGHVGDMIEADFFLKLHEAARDYHCVGGMIFPVFCFVYLPFLAIVAILGFGLPAQRVEDKKDFSMRTLGLQFGFLAAVLVMAITGGVVWRSYSSEGLGKLKW